MSQDSLFYPKNLKIGDIYWWNSGEDIHRTYNKRFVLDVFLAPEITNHARMFKITCHEFNAGKMLFYWPEHKAMNISVLREGKLVQGHDP